MDSTDRPWSRENSGAAAWRGPSPQSVFRRGLDPVAALQPVTVLIADDEPVVRMVLEDMLLKLGYHVLCAVDGLQALEIFRQHQDVINVLVFDLSMPNMDGEELFSRVRQLSPETKTIMITGYNEIVSLDHLRSQGLSGFIAKPFGVDEIKSEIGRVLSP